MRIAITRPVSPRLGECELTHVGRASIDVERAAAQHAAYETALVSLGCELVRAPAAPDAPDSVFVEDTAVVLDEVAIMARPGAPSRRSEIGGIAEVLVNHRTLLFIEEPGTLDGGDVLVMGRRLFVGRSSRTNEAAIDQLDRLLSRLGYQVRLIRVDRCLHLKSAVTAVSADRVLVNPGWVDTRELQSANPIEIDPREPHAANVLLVGGHVIAPAAHLRTRSRLEQAGCHVVTVDVSELAKAEGGVTCCSLIFDRGQGPGAEAL